MPFDLFIQEENLAKKSSAFTRLQKFLLRNVRSSKGRNTPTGQFDVPQIRAQARALKYDLIQVNGPKITRYIAHDIDSKNASRAWIDAGLPRPTLIMINPRNGHAHYLYELTIGFITDPNDPRYSGKTIRFVNAIIRAHQRAMIDAGYKVDLTFRGHLVKNPWYSGWEVIAHDQAYTFDELRGLLDLPWHQPNSTTKDSQFHPDGRNCTLFERLRFWAYRSVRFYPDETAFEVVLHQQAQSFIQDFNSLVGFPTREIEDTIRSVCRYVWNRYLQGHYRTDNYTHKVKVMDLPAEMDLAERELAGQQYTCDQRNEKTRNKILQAILQLQADGVVVTKAAVARITKLNPRTIRSHWPHVTVPSSVEPVTTCGSDVLATLFPATVPPTCKVTVETEYPSGTSNLQAGFACCGRADTIDPQLPIPPDAPTSIYTSHDVVGFREYERNWSREHGRHIEGQMDVGAYIATLRYAAEMADRGILVDGIPSEVKRSAIRRMNTYYERKWKIKPPAENINTANSTSHRYFEDTEGF